MTRAILFDATKCTGCRGCQVACKKWNGLTAEVTKNRGTYENPPDLTADTWLTMRFNEVANGNGGISWLFSRRSCMHCSDAGCILVCPTGALYKHSQGMVLYDESLCSGCGYCIEACPFDIPRRGGGYNQLTGKGKVAEKCWLCADRITANAAAVPQVDRIPACVKTCPPGALVFGDRFDMITAAKARIRHLEDQGKTATLYGETEVGGTQVMYILDNTPENYYLPAKPSIASVRAWQSYLKPIGYGVIGVVALGLAVNFMASRARMLQGKEDE